MKKGNFRKALVFPTALVILISALLTGCASNDTASLKTVKAGEKKRVVALSKSLGELWLLSGGELVGITEDGAELSDEAKVIGTITNPNSEAVLSLSPDIILLTESIPAQKELSPVFKEAGIRALSPEVGSFEDYADIMKELTDETERKDLYELNVERVRENIDKIKAQVPSDDEAYLAIRVSATKNKVLKRDYFACEIISDMNLKNIADDDSSLDELNIEAIAAADPDYIFIVPQGGEDEALLSYKQAFSERPVWNELSAVKNERVYILPKELFQYKPNNRWDEAYEYVYNLIYEK